MTDAYIRAHTFTQSEQIIAETCPFCGLPIAVIAAHNGSLRFGIQAELHEVILHHVMPVTWYGYPAARRIWDSWGAK